MEQMDEYQKHVEWKDLHMKESMLYMWFQLYKVPEQENLICGRKKI